MSAALTTGINNNVNDLFGVKTPADFSFGAKFTNNFINGVVGQETRIKIFHEGKLDYDAIATDALGNAFAPITGTSYRIITLKGYRGFMDKVLA